MEQLHLSMSEVNVSKREEVRAAHGWFLLLILARPLVGYAYKKKAAHIRKRKVFSSSKR